MIKKITVVGTLPPWKGISAYVDGFVHALADHVAVQVIDFASLYPTWLYPGGTPKQSGEQQKDYTNIDHRLLLSRRNPFSWIYAGYAITGSLLHLQYWIRFLAPAYVVVGLYAKLIKKIPIILTVHNTKHHEHARRKTLIDKVVYSVANMYIVHTHEGKQQLEEIVGTKKKIIVLSHGIITPGCTPISKKKARKILGIREKVKLLLHFGHIRPYKGLKLMLHALGLLLKKDDTYRLLIAGTCRGKRSSYQEVINSQGLEKYIIRIDGFLSNDLVTQVFSASDLLVLPYTHFDAQSGVVALGFGYGIPMIVSDLGGLTQMIDEKRYNFPVGDVAGLVTCIEQLHMHEAATYVNTRKLLFSREHIIQEYLNHLNSTKF